MRKYLIKTFGCQMNESDSERIATFLEANNLKPEKNIKQADLVIFNTCGVRQSAENRVYGQVHNLRKQNKKCIIVITGCLAHRKDVQKRLKGKADLFIPINKITEIFKHLNLPASSISNSYLSLEPKYQNKNSALVPIMTGCNNFCSYCVVPYARGREWSRPPQEIFKEIKNLSENGYQEIILLGQNVNSYNNEHKPSFPSPVIAEDKLRQESISQITTFSQLLEKLAVSYPQVNFSFLTSHPKNFSDDLIKTISKNKNLSRKIHLPVQSGSDKVLKLMNRPYTQKKYLNLIERIKKNIPEAKISTDVIVGFPGETETDFRETIKVFKKVGYFEAYINKYSPRPETISFKLGDPINWNKKKKREKILRELIKQ